ncbi:MAG: V-type ATP synthase subunit E [Clostridia bacterium]|nr:V-type ATP synthase subunit E [Clostridia bacterium]
MSALDRIIADIARQAREKADGILEEAGQRAAEIRALGEASCADKQREFDDATERECAQIKSRAESAHRQSRRRALLQAHHEVIDEVIAEAKAVILGLPEGDYFEFLFRLFEKSAQPKDGVIRFAPADATRLPDGFLARCGRVFPDNTLELLENADGIERGFIIEYGPVLQNCSVEGIFEAQGQTLREKAYEILDKDGASEVTE